MPLTDVQRIHFEVKVIGSTLALGGQAQITVTPLHYIRTTFVTPMNAANALTAFSAKLKTPWLAMASVSWSWDKITARCLDGYSENWVDLAAVVAGGVAGDMEPGQIAAVISKKSALRGKSYNGRCYIPGIAEADTLGNALTAGAKTRLDTLAAAMDDTVTDSDGNVFVPAIYSRTQSSEAEGFENIIMTPMLNATAREILGNQDQRRSKVTA